MFILVQVISVSRIPTAMVFAAVLITTPFSLLSLAACILLLAIIEISDLLDGMLARKYNVVSELGATLDPYTDSISRLIVYWALAENNQALALVPLTMAIRDITVSYCRILIAQHGQTVSAKSSGKAKAILQGAGGFILILCPLSDQFGQDVAFAVSWVVIIATALSAIEYVKEAMKLLNKKS